LTPGEFLAVRGDRVLGLNFDRLLGAIDIEGFFGDIDICGGSALQETDPSLALAFVTFVVNPAIVRSLQISLG
jgi:hypothetical protein